MPKGSLDNQQSTTTTVAAPAPAEQETLSSISETLSLQASKPCPSEIEIVCLDENDKTDDSNEAFVDDANDSNRNNRKNQLEPLDYVNKTKLEKLYKDSLPNYRDDYKVNRKLDNQIQTQQLNKLNDDQALWKTKQSQYLNEKEVNYYSSSKNQNTSQSRLKSSRLHKNLHNNRKHCFNRQVTQATSSKLLKKSTNHPEYHKNYATREKNSRVDSTTKRYKKLNDLIELFEHKVNLIEARELSLKSAQISNESNENMRNIITPVKYDPKTSTEEEEDSLEFCTDLYDDYMPADCFDNGKRLHQHVTKVGVCVLPKRSAEECNLQKKLTKTNWQPPTDGRQYERKLKPAICSHSSNDVMINNPTSASPRRLVSSSPLSSTAAVANNRGPPIVKHQPTSSRRLLHQLARLRRLSEPNYRVKRPEKVAQVESLIDQLERATKEWDEDEFLLDRAERRDWPAEYQERYMNSEFPEDISVDILESNNNCERQTRVHQKDLEENNDQDTSLSPFGRRLDVNPIESNIIAKSHSSIFNLHMMGGIQYRDAGNWNANATLNRHLRGKPRAFADRYFDDLAVRRLTSRPNSSTSTLSRPFSPTLDIHHQHSTTNSPQQIHMSYLLCSNAYTPIMDTKNSFSPTNTLDDRIRSDDLHSRNLRIKQDPHEPPFGIPRQEAIASSHSTASHYTRQHNINNVVKNSCVCNCSFTHNKTSQQDQTNSKRSDSKVSFVKEPNSGRISVDSGLVAGSPVTTQGRESATSRLTLDSPFLQSSNNKRRQQQTKQLCDTSSQTEEYEFDMTNELEDVGEVNLEEELNSSRRPKSNFKLASNQSSCESPILERYKAELVAKPIKSRPKINIENPRSKSPLLRISTKTPSKNQNVDLKKVESTSAKTNVTPVQIQCYSDTIPKLPYSPVKATSEAEVKFDFQDEDDDELFEYMTKAYKARKIVTNSDSKDSAASEGNESSLERLNYRGEPKIPGVKSNISESHKNKQSTKNGPVFSIGEYKSIDKANLIFL